MEGQEDKRDPLTAAVIGAAIEVHREMGCGLLESTYEECLAFEFQLRGIAFRRQVVMPVVYKGKVTRDAYRIDFIVEERLIVELKAVDRTHEIHEAQILTYMKHSGIGKGLLLNFYVPMMRLGIRRYVSGGQESPD